MEYDGGLEDETCTKTLPYFQFDPQLNWVTGKWWVCCLLIIIPGHAVQVWTHVSRFVSLCHVTVVSKNYSCSCGGSLVKETKISRRPAAESV